MMKAIVIDDENKSRRLLEALLQKACPEITAIFQASDLVSGVQLIEQENPDIVFLDIEMPNYSGLQILEFFDADKVNFQIIFVTAYNQYAIEAFKLSAIDYLLKPIDVNELKNAVDKVTSLLNEKTLRNQLDELKKAFKELSLSKLAIEVPSGISFVNYNDIYYFEADRMYTKVFLKNKRPELICKPLKHFVDQLQPKPIFYKPHRSYLINLKHIKEFSKKDGYHIVMENDKTIPISKDKKDEFLSLIEEVF